MSWRPTVCEEALTRELTVAIPECVGHAAPQDGRHIPPLISRLRENHEQHPNRTAGVPVLPRQFRESNVGTDIMPYARTTRGGNIDSHVFHMMPFDWTQRETPCLGFHRTQPQLFVALKCLNIGSIRYGRVRVVYPKHAFFVFNIFFFIVQVWSFFFVLACCFVCDGEFRMVCTHMPPPLHAHLLRGPYPYNTQVKPKVEAMLLDEIQLHEALEDTLGKEELERELDAAFEAQGGENADLSKAFPVPEPEQQPIFMESEVQDAEIA